MWCECDISKSQNWLVHCSWPWFVQIHLHIVSARHHLDIFTPELLSELWDVFAPCRMTSYINVLTVIYQTKQLQAKRRRDLGMFVDIMEPFIISEYLMDSVCWQRQIDWWDILIFIALHHVFHVPQQKTDLFCPVCPFQFTALTFDMSYQHRTHHPPGLHIPQWKH